MNIVEKSLEGGFFVGKFDIRRFNRRIFYKQKLFLDVSVLFISRLSFLFNIAYDNAFGKNVCIGLGLWHDILFYCWFTSKIF